MKQYTAVFEREKDGSYSVYVPDLPGCASMGGTYEEALANIREAIAGHLDGFRADGLPLPEPYTQIATIEVDAA